MDLCPSSSHGERDVSIDYLSFDVLPRLSLVNIAHRRPGVPSCRGGPGQRREVRSTVLIARGAGVASSGI